MKKVPDPAGQNSPYPDMYEHYIYFSNVLRSGGCFPGQLSMFSPELLLQLLLCGAEDQGGTVQPPAVGHIRPWHICSRLLHALIGVNILNLDWFPCSGCAIHYYILLYYVYRFRMDYFHLTFYFYESYLLQKKVWRKNWKKKVENLFSAGWGYETTHSVIYYDSIHILGPLHNKSRQNFNMLNYL